MAIHFCNINITSTYDLECFVYFRYFCSVKLSISALDGKIYLSCETWKIADEYNFCYFMLLFVRQCLSFYCQDAGGHRSAGAIVPPVKHSISWHDAIRIKRSVCHASACCLQCSSYASHLVCYCFSVRLLPWWLPFCFFSIFKTFHSVRLGAKFRIRV